jgi:hypothetical protein
MILFHCFLLPFPAAIIRTTPLIHSNLIHRFCQVNPSAAGQFSGTRIFSENAGLQNSASCKRFADRLE